MQGLKSELQAELLENILPYWINKMQDHENGGFYGRIDGQENLHKLSNKGIVLNARILWTFSAAYRIYKNPEYLLMAERAYKYIQDKFFDKKHGGVYWQVNYKGEPVNTRKQIYAQGFTLYGYSEFYRATGKPEALDIAKNLFCLIEKYAYDKENGGYIEALSEDWKPIEDMKLSTRDANMPKSMNTHLHILEPYTNLLRIWKDKSLLKAQERLIRNFNDHIVNPDTKHLNLFFDMNWIVTHNIISYGHDIEAAWLLVEASEIVGNPKLTEKIKKLSLEVIEASYEGKQPDGSMIYEKTPDHLDADRHWWVQAETVVGSMYAYQISGDNKYLEAAKKCWDYIKNHIIDKKDGEWVWSTYPDGKQNNTDDKAGFWKCPYHNARMCIEIKELKI